MKKSIKLVTLLAAATLVAGVAVAPASQAAKIKACLALDTGGVDDHSFNASAWDGAKSTAGIADVQYLPSASSADFAPNIKKFVDLKCDLIIGVGFAIGGDLVASAKANPKIKYAIVDDAGLSCNADYSSCLPVANVKGLTFKTDEPSFQAGYLAAGYSKTGKVATYGGAPYPTVTMFMDGYARGVAYYNKVNNKNVQVLGWDPAKPSAGTFVGDFSNTTKAGTISTGFEQQGADVIFPVAGNLAATTAANSLKSKKSVVIWVDKDGVIASPEYASVILTSVVKGVGTSVASTITSVKKGQFTNASYVGTIANSGVFLSGYHSFQSAISSRLALEVKRLAAQIKSGAVSVK